MINIGCTLIESSQVSTGVLDTLSLDGLNLVSVILSANVNMMGINGFVLFLKIVIVSENSYHYTVCWYLFMHTLIIHSHSMTRIHMILCRRHYVPCGSWVQDMPIEYSCTCLWGSLKNVSCLP